MIEPRGSEARPLTFIAAAVWTIGAVLLLQVAIAVTEAARPGAMADLVNVTACELLAYSALVFAMLRVYAPETRVREAVALRAVGPLAVLGAAALGAGIYPALDLVDGLVARRFPPSTEELELLGKLLAAPTSARRVALGVAVLVLMPAVEEVFFRGVIFGGLRKSGRAPLVVLGSAVYFTAARANERTVASVFALGLLLAWLRDRTRSIVPTFVAHAAFFAVPVVPLVMGRDPALDLAFPRTWILGGLGVAAFVAGVFEWRSRDGA
jgi:membrane protease YdiL (CAAX protease family)